MNQIQRVASAALFERYLKTWGGQVSIQVAKTGSVSLHPTGEVVLPAEAVETFPGISRLAGEHERFTKAIKPANDQHWDIPGGNVLEAQKKYTTWPERVEKFSWNPVTGEFLLIPPGQQHATVQGKAPFDDYVRGIILRKQKKVTFRPFIPTWAKSFDPEEIKVVSFEGQYALKEALERLGNRDWDYQFDINNRMLQEQTGIFRW